MDKIWEAIGGRKFIMSLVLIAVGTLVELKTDRGVSASFAGLLVGILGAFSAANALTTIKVPGLSDTPPTEPVAPAAPVIDPAILESIKEIDNKINASADVLAGIVSSVGATNKLVNVAIKSR